MNRLRGLELTGSYKYTTDDHTGSQIETDGSALMGHLAGHSPWKPAYKHKRCLDDSPARYRGDALATSHQRTSLFN